MIHCRAGAQKIELTHYSQGPCLPQEDLGDADGLLLIKAPPEEQRGLFVVKGSVHLDEVARQAREIVLLHGDDWRRLVAALRRCCRLRPIV